MTDTKLVEYPENFTVRYAIDKLAGAYTYIIKTYPIWYEADHKQAHATLARLASDLRVYCVSTSGGKLVDKFPVNYPDPVSKHVLNSDTTKPFCRVCSHRVENLDSICGCHKS